MKAAPSLRLRARSATAVLALLLAASACGEEEPWQPNGNGFAGAGGGGIPLPPEPSCDAAASGTADVAAPELMVTLFDRWQEGWLASPAIADLDGDGTNEIVLVRYGIVYAFTPEGIIQWQNEVSSQRIWASPIVADFRDDSQLETVVAARGEIFMLDAAGNTVSGFPIAWDDELRSIAAGDVDGDGQLDIVVASTHHDPDVVHAFHANGAPVAGFPPMATGSSGCEQDDRCYIAGAFDQNVAVGDLNGDGHHDIVVPHDNAYVSIHHGTGEAFDAHEGFPSIKTPGVRYLHDLALAQQGWADDEETALQAHFTNTPPAIADLDGDGSYDVVLVASVQNASQNDRLKGVAVWAIRRDASRLSGFDPPVHFPNYLGGLWDLGDNMVAATNQATVADIDPTRPGPEIVFAGFDGRIHAIDAAGQELWFMTYTQSDSVLCTGVAVADLSGDGLPEVVFNSHSLSDGQSALTILDAGGNLQHEIPLPRRGSMAVPTIGDVDGDGQLEIVVSLKDAEDQAESALVYTVPGSSDNCLLWPTGRGNLLRNGWVRNAGQ